MEALRWFLSCFVFVIFVIVVRFAAQQSPAEVLVRGIVTSEGQPLAGATVRVYGGESPALTEADGHFALPVTLTGARTFLTAAKPGYYNSRRPIARRIRFDLRALPATDNAKYVWQDPSPNPSRKDNCGNCHSGIYAEWAVDAHSRAAVNPVVLNMYNGTDAQGRANVGPGYRVDWPDEGNCASCHAPLSTAEGNLTYLNQVDGVARTGVSCDFCHKVKEVSAHPQFPHVAEMRLLRPSSGHKLIFGPFDDAMFPGDIPDFSYSPLFNSSRFCAGCHDGTFWGTPVYETYTEWRKSPYATAGIECQQCHMRSNSAITRMVNEKDGGIARRAGRIGSHQTMGEVPTELLKSAIRMETSTEVNGPALGVTVNIVNSGAGHHVPTGQPMRNMVLLVSPVDANGRDLRLLSGDRVPVWGGSYGGRAGSGFAKVLATVSEYARAPLAPEETTNGGDFPAPFWRRNKIVSDNRIAAKAEATKTYWFDAAGAIGPVTVTTELVYRRAFQQLAEVKGWNFKDVELSVNRTTVSLVARRAP